MSVKLVLSGEVRDIFKNGGGQQSLGQTTLFQSALVLLDIK